MSMDEADVEHPAGQSRADVAPAAADRRSDGPHGPFIDKKRGGARAPLSGTRTAGSTGRRELLHDAQSPPLYW